MLHIGSPLTVEAAVMFLYGKCPDITMDNIAYLLYLAQFLLISNLKALCVKWLQAQTVDWENVVKFLHLSSLYGFELPACDTYIIERLDECLENQQLLTLTKESVEYLFSNKTLSYVSSDIKFKFIRKWTHYLYDARQRHFPDLLRLINIADVSPTHIQDIKCDPLFSSFEIEADLSVAPQTLNQPVLFMKALSGSADFWAYDLERELWFGFQSTQNDKCYDVLYVDDNSSNNILVYSSRKAYNKVSIIIHDITNDNVKESDLVDGYNNEKLKHGHICIQNSTAYFVASDNVSIPKYHYPIEEIQHMHHCQGLLMMNMMGVSIPGALSLVGLGNSEYRKRTMVSTLYMGGVNLTGGDTRMTPVLSVPFDISDKLFVNKANVVAWLFDRKELYLFDANIFSLERLSIATTSDDTLRASDSGFVLYNRKRLVDISRQQGPSLTSRYKVKEIILNIPAKEDVDAVRYEYTFLENMWTRHTGRYYGNEVLTVEYAIHEALKTSESISNITWIPMQTVDGQTYHSFLENAVKTCLPRSMLKCHVKCPHCERRSRERCTSNTGRNYVVNWGVYDDDSDIDSSVYGGYDGFDDYYYYSSDYSD